MGSVILFGVVQGVFGYLHDHIFLGQKGLTAQAGVGLQPPSAIKQVLFTFIEFVERRKAFAHDNVAGRAGATHVAGVLDVDVVFQQGFADGGSGWGAHFRALRAILGVRKNSDDGHKFNQSRTECAR